MEALLDKDVINVGDNLFDLIDGVVTVNQVRDGTILCTRYNSNGAAIISHYSLDGIKSRGRVRTLYWHNPIVVEPRKDAKLWASQIRLIKNTITEFGNFITSAAVKRIANVTDEDLYDPTVSSAYAAYETGLLTGSEVKSFLNLLREERKTK